MPPLWTYPRTWADDSNDPVTSYQFNTHVRDNLLYLHRPYSCYIETIAAQETPNDEWATLSFSDDAASALWNNGDIWDGDSGRFTFPVSGLWSVNFRAVVASNATSSVRTVRWHKNGKTNSNNSLTLFTQQPFTSTVAPPTIAGKDMAGFTAGDYLEFDVLQDSGDDLNVTKASVEISLMAVQDATPSWTAPRTWANPEVVTAAMMNAHVRDNLKFLYYRPAVKLRVDTDVTLTTNTWTTNTIDTVDFQNVAMWVSGTPTRITPGIAGRYQIWAAPRWTASGVGGRGVRARFNGSATNLAPLGIYRTAGAGATINRTWGLTEVALSATDYIELQTWQDSGANLDQKNLDIVVLWVGGV